jgi:hypothetical protein
MALGSATPSARAGLVGPDLRAGRSSRGGDRLFSGNLLPQEKRQSDRDFHPSVGAHARTPSKQAFLGDSKSEILSLPTPLTEPASKNISLAKSVDQARRRLAHGGHGGHRFAHDFNGAADLTPRKLREKRASARRTHQASMGQRIRVRLIATAARVVEVLRVLRAAWSLQSLQSSKPTRARRVWFHLTLENVERQTA